MKILVFYIAFTFACLSAFAQSSQETFGKNRVQYKQFDWKYISTKHFHIYYYQEGANLAHNTARIAEEEYNRITSIIGYTPFHKTNLIVYNSPGDLRQSNIGIQNRAFVGGETQLIKQKKEIAFNGSYLDFKKSINETVADMLINSMLFGGSMKEVIQSSYLLHIPEWFISGASAYIGKGWDSEMDDAVRDLIVNNNFNPTGLIGDDATIIGQSIWNYIAVSYGETTVSSILNLSRIVRNEEISIEHSVGQEYPDFLKAWRQYYIQEIAIDTAATTPSRKTKVRKINNRRYDYNDIAFNRDSSLVAYTENFMGRQRVNVYNTETGKKKLIWRKGTRIVDQQVDYGVPLVAWRSKQELSILTYRKGKPFLMTKNIVSGSKEKKYFNTFDQITSFDYNQINNDMALTAYKNGQSDLYIYDYKEDRARRITKDLYDDLHVKYIPGTDDIIFSSNRLNDTLREDRGEYESITENFNLFKFDTKKKNPVLERITNAISSEIYPAATSNGNIYFLMLWDHQKQLYNFDSTTNRYYQKTNFEANVKHFNISPDGSTLAYILRNKGKQFLYIDTTFDVANNFGYLKLKDIKIEEPEPEIQSIEQLLAEIDLDLLTFEGDSVFNPLGSALNTTTQKPDLTIYGPFPAKLSLGVDYIVTALEIDPLRGSGILMHAKLTDMMSNHHFNFDIFAVSNLRTSSFGAEYENLKHRLDYRLKLERKNLSALSNETFIFQNYSSVNASFGISHPFSEAARLTFAPQYINTRFTDYGQINTPDSLNHYTGYHLEYVFDNTKEHGLNMLDGTRIKLQFTTYNHFGKRFEGDTSNRLGFLPGTPDKDFARLHLDARKYFKLYRQMVFATRASYGEFFGPAKKNFLLGGMDNWLFNRRATPPGTSPNPLTPVAYQDNSDLLFVDFATNMRGFRYNSRFGHRYLLSNNELRLPLAKMLHKGPIGSNFFRNLQFVGFYDFGTAWNQGIPFSTNNDINTQVIQAPDTPFKATVRNYQNPFLMGYGFGMRTMVLGYYLKVDLAWGIEDFVNQGKELYFSFGYDF